MSNSRIPEQSGTGQKQQALPTRIGQGSADEPRRPNPRTLDGYQVPFPKPIPPPPRSTPPLKAQKTAGNRVTTGGPFAQKTMPRTPSNLGPGRISAVKTGSPATRTYGTSNYASRDYDSSPSAILRTKSTPKSASRLQYGRVSYPMTTKTASVFPAHQTPRISSQSDSQRRHSMNPALSVKKVVDVTTKTTTTIKPLWQQLDNDHEEELLRRNKRDRDGNMLGFVKRMHPTARRGYAAANAPDPNALDPDRPKAEIMPKLRLRVGDVEPEDSDSNDDEPRYRPQARLVKRKSESLRPQAAVKRSAARKVEYIDTSSESESSDATQTMAALSDQSQDDQPSEHDELASSSSSEDIIMEDYVPDDNVPEIVLLDNPSRLPVSSIDPDFIDKQDEEPLEDLVSAVEALSLPAIRMQKTSRLPFLLRNVRQGFFNRCRKMQIPIYSEGHSISFSVRYEHIAGTFYRTKIESWCCPLCDLLGTVKTREILDCHLRWDHPEVYCEWQEGVFRAVEQKEYWELRLLIPEIAQEDGDLQNDHKEVDLETGAHTPTEHKDALMTPTTRNALSPFPSVTLSPPSATRDTTLSETPVEDVKPFKLETRASENDASLTPSIRSTLNDTSSQTRSTTAATGSSRPVVGTAQRRPSSAVNPSPPPPDNPLGPAAQRPYLPAESDYGGPTVYYSCRPGGECLFDLLGTLPMEPFGLLDWEVIDREEEIYESDEVKEEYKVVHALWARWIMLNRNKFISNYFRGVIAFVDQYWKIIHKAAGWDALRYWLFILLGNQFLSGREVAKVLLHYEGLTDMAHWYD